MSEPFVAEIRMFGGNFAPVQWAMCNGQILSISQNTALFSLIGTYYGGNGTSNFALPNLQSRAPMHQGQGVGLSQRVLGEADGTETVTLISTELPGHTHGVMAVSSAGTQTTPVNNSWASSTTRPYSNQAPNAAMAPGTLGSTGGNQPHDNRQPYLAVTFIICLFGVYPSRN
jgi:microcystin-dependent protein